MRLAKLEQLSTVIASIHEAGTAPEKWPRALASIIGLLGASRAALMDMAADTDRLIDLQQLGHDPRTAETYVKHYYHLDPARALAVTMPALEVMTVHEYFPASFRATNEYFAFAQRHDIGDVVGVATRVDEGRRQLLSLQRPYDAADFGAEAKQLMGLLVPHLELARRVQRKLAGVSAAKSALEAGLDRMAAATFLVNACGKLRHLNAAAHALLGTSRQVCCSHGKLAFKDAKLNAAFQSAMKRAVCEESRSSALPMQLADGRPAEILVAPLRPGQALDAPLAFVLITAPASDVDAIARRLQQLYRLTPAEGRIAAMLAMGESVEQIARAKGVSDATLRTQLRSIFAKTGTRRQADIVRLALAGALMREDS
jgi:DNA-binding CsgD family transcriptional regulator